MRGSRRDQTSRTRRRALAVCAPLALAVALAAVTAATAGAAAPTWGQASELALPNDASSSTPAASAAWVACPASGDCAAVGSYTDSLGDHDALVMSESGGAWGQGAPITLPSGADPSMAGASGVTTSLESVSCAAPGDCAAVGRYVDGSGDTNAMVASESGGAWGPASEMAAPSGADSNPKASLASVSCTGVGTCVAVGSLLPQRQPRGDGRQRVRRRVGSGERDPAPELRRLAAIRVLHRGRLVRRGRLERRRLGLGLDAVRHRDRRRVAHAGHDRGAVGRRGRECRRGFRVVHRRKRLRRRRLLPGRHGNRRAAGRQRVRWRVGAGRRRSRRCPSNAGTSSGSGGGHPEALLASVWCTDVSDCVAVGSFEDDALNGHQLAVTESGGVGARRPSSPACPRTRRRPPTPRCPPWRAPRRALPRRRAVQPRRDERP